MPSSSLVKYVNRDRSNGKPLHWGRLDIDGLPFRGANPPLLRAAEYDERVVRVSDAHNAFFDVRKPEQNEQYLEILDKTANGWFKIVCLERFVNKTTEHYVEWLEYYLEDGVTRVPATHAQQHTMELDRGQTAVPEASADYPN